MIEYEFVALLHGVCKYRVFKHPFLIKTACPSINALAAEIVSESESSAFFESEGY